MKFQIPVPDQVWSRIRVMPGSPVRKQRLFERAIHTMLDELGAPWPNRPEPDPLYIALWRGDAFLGHLGPFDDKRDAERVLKLWKRTRGYSATMTKRAVGVQLTNRDGGGLPL